MSWVAGIDYSTHAIDVVLIDEDDTRPPVWYRWELEGNDAFDRARSVRYVLFGNVFYDVMAIGIEDPRGQNAGAIYRVQGAILARLPARTLVQPWIPSQWRKAAGLKGNATKAQVAEWVMAERFLETMDPLLDDWPQDACDAYCIALATRAAIEKQAAA